MSHKDEQALANHIGTGIRKLFKSAQGDRGYVIVYFEPKPQGPVSVTTNTTIIHNLRDPMTNEKSNAAAMIILAHAIKSLEKNESDAKN